MTARKGNNNECDSCLKHEADLAQAEGKLTRRGFQMRAGGAASLLSALWKPAAGCLHFSSQMRCSQLSAVTSLWSPRALTRQEGAEGLVLSQLEATEGLKSLRCASGPIAHCSTRNSAFPENRVTNTSIFTNSVFKTRLLNQRDAIIHKAA